MTDAQLAILLVLASAVMHATWNAIVKLSGDRLAVMAVVDSICLVLAATLALFVPLPAPAQWGFLAVSGVIAVAYKIGLLGAYRHGDFSQAYPMMRGSAPVLVALISIGLGLEQLPWSGLAGIALISLGLFTLVDWRGGRPILVAYALAAGVALAVSTLIDGTAVRTHGSPLSYLAWLEVLEHLALPAYALTARRPQYLAVLTGQWRRAGIGAVNRIGSYGLMVWAMSLAPIAPLAALRETSVVFGALIGYFIIKEKFGARRVVATSLVLGGILVLQVARAGWA